ncbi:MAG: hypothetical protein DRJ57_05750 [Thermoprotei archaeon]|nr:MAG: hypothetical protein DRJ57_05750 [Thermoprotei archaeon]
MSIEELVLRTLAKRGVAKARVLSEDERKKVKELEEDYSSRPTQWGYPVNVGVLECLNRRHVVAVLTYPFFKWPPGPYALLKLDDATVGVIDESGLHLDRSTLKRAGGKHYVIYPPLRLPELDELMTDCVVGSPSPPTHRYLAHLLGGGSEYGSLLLGFNSLRRRYTSK